MALSIIDFILIGSNFDVSNATSIRLGVVALSIKCSAINCVPISACAAINCVPISACASINCVPISACASILVVYTWIICFTNDNISYPIIKSYLWFV